jgi:hypothetical protein
LVASRAFPNEPLPSASPKRDAAGLLFWAVVSDSTEEAVELLPTREEAEAIVQAWDRDEPEQGGALRVEQIEFRTGTAN